MCNRDFHGKPSGLFEFQESRQDLEDGKSPKGLCGLPEVHENREKTQNVNQGFRPPDILSPGSFSDGIWSDGDGQADQYI
jgi:hypothetical protein